VHRTQETGFVFTIVCCYNNVSVYRGFVESLKKQSCPYKLIGISNEENGRFSSCSAAYNSVINEIDTKYVIYSHQDILLERADTLENFICYLNRIDEDDVLGVAGTLFHKPAVYTNIMHVNNITKELIHAGTEQVEDMMSCDTLDECFFGGYTKHFLLHPFNKVLCPSWHLYAVENCLQTKTRGNSVYVCDVSLIHLSSGQLPSGRFPDSFYKEFSRLCKAYAKRFPIIRTTCAYAKTNFLGRMEFAHPRLFHIYYSFRHQIGNLLRYLGLQR
ncbi:MAG: hypothetical protein IJ702_08195, partial [Fretibacterium sp.]|nr:hypothetical protein [Fretibacterium sp.]